MNNEWAMIPTHPLYEASRDGMVRRIGKLNALKPWTHKSGHLYLRLNKKTRQVHHLIIEAFGTPKEHPSHEVRHLNGVPSDNRIDNLEWGTRKQNIFDYIELKGRHMCRNATSAEIAKSIKLEHDGKFGTGVRLSKKYGVSIHTVSEIKKGKTFKYL